MFCGVMENQSTLNDTLPPYRLVKSIGPGATHLQMEIFMEYIKVQGALISVVSARFKIEQLFCAIFIIFARFDRRQFQI